MWPKRSTVTRVPIGGSPMKAEQTGCPPKEFHLVLTKEQVETTLCTLWAAAEITKGRQAQAILSAADALRDQIGLSGFVIRPVYPETEPKRKRRWSR
jgi:hypothetical protein